MSRRPTATTRIVEAGRDMASLLGGKRWKASLAAVLVVGAIVGLTLGWVTLHRAPPSAHAVIGAPTGPVPFPGAVKAPSISAAESALGWHILRPSSCAASDASVD